MTTDDQFGNHYVEPWYSTSWYGTRFDHQRLRDDRTEATARYLNGGVYEYSYLARATAPGSFVVPPPRAEEIHSPETFGRGSSDVVVIQD